MKNKLDKYQVSFIYLFIFFLIIASIFAYILFVKINKNNINIENNLRFNSQNKEKNKILNNCILLNNSSEHIFKLSNFSSRYNFNPASSSTIVIDSEDNNILYSFNKDKKLPMASTTKILTAITVLENSNLLDKVIIKKEATNIEGSSIYLKQGDIYTIEDLLYGLMLRSGNDSAVALSLEVGGSIENFAKLMNQTAKKIGAVNSNFMNPHGLHHKDHYTTAYDLAIITSYAMKNPDFRKIVDSKSHTITNFKDNTKQVLCNKNKMLSTFKGANGVKTGYTLNAGRCLVSSAKRGDFELICVTFNCRPMWEKSSEILEKIFSTFDRLKIIEKDKPITKIQLGNDNKLYSIVCKKDCNILIKKEDRGNLKIKLNINNPIKNIKIGENIGKIEITLNNKLIFSEKIYTI